MTQFLPENLLKLFTPRPPIPYLPPVEELSINKKRPPIQGLAAYLSQFETKQEPLPPKPHIESREEKRQRRRKEKEELLAYKLEQQIAMWNPSENPDATTDPYKTIFVTRLSYETTESKLRREFEVYGKIAKIVMPTDKEGKPRGYAFVEYTHKSDMTQAYKKGDGVKIDGRRVLVDYERGRTNKKWLPRRLGGGKGETRKAREPRREREDDAGNSSYGGGSGYRGDSGRPFRDDFGSRDRPAFREDRSRGGFNPGRDREDRTADYRPGDRNGGDRNGGDRYRGRDDRDRRDRDKNGNY